MKTTEQSIPSVPAMRRRFPLLAAVFLIVVVFGCSIYANLSFAVTNRQNFRYFPPFKPFVDQNSNRHLGAEYYSIAKSIVAGEGFSSPFQEKTGPTAWMPPVLPAILAGLLWLTGGDRDAVMAVMIFFQVYILITTGILVLILVWQSTHRRLAVWFAALLFVAGLAYEFKLCFQNIHDCGIVMLAVDLVIAGFCWLGQMGRWPATICWGVLGGICALISPIVGLMWGVLSLIAGVQQRAWSRFGIAVLASVVVLMPWTVRNYLVLGRLIPVKSNLAYELYQSQCLQPDGLIQRSTFSTHPYGSPNRERQEYKRLGEMPFLDGKRQLFWQSVRSDPLEFIDRVACRFLGTTLWYIPFERNESVRRPVVFWVSRLTHPLPFLALLFLAGSAVWLPLHRGQWVVMVAYVVYLGPYIVASYYERYGVPLLGVKVVLVAWAGIRLASVVTWWKQEPLPPAPSPKRRGGGSEEPLPPAPSPKRRGGGSEEPLPPAPSPKRRGGDGSPTRKRGDESQPLSKPHTRKIATRLPSTEE
jgi:hypothetical protein